ncbi:MULTISPECIES: DNA-methyltransferase [Prauserella salsuginis group]|uniref:Methyltransferase n=1 Tax=Prauserella salsuginis TaxID=387889 RepID=A0ABW6G5T5_9PSEU|nr:MULTISPECIES: site-specific DNA-methyltransferase [Prauserella salsuginis group]MCR3719153.1 site-specific DNA-methyltransferase (adenine-specific) [Prauserella flava]MCR3735834.1 site-specific DNA-methyltransferase (adenine-specific) [Prauserella salsuginis]
MHQLHHGDALAVLPTLDASSVDTIITDPPYNSGGRTASERRNQTAKDKYVSGGSGVEKALEDFTGDNRDQRGFLAWLSLTLGECLRVARPGAHLLVFSDWRQAPVTSDALQVAGWTWQGTLVWHKPIARPRRGGFKANAEYILWGTNGKFDGSREVYLPGVFSASQPRGRQRRHITQKPVDGLLDELVEICPSGGTVLDPFAGSGTTGEAALRSDRSFVGIELSDHYHRIARDRLDEVSSTP